MPTLEVVLVKSCSSFASMQAVPLDAFWPSCAVAQWRRCSRHEHALVLTPLHIVISPLRTGTACFIQDIFMRGAILPCTTATDRVRAAQWRRYFLFSRLRQMSLHSSFGRNKTGAQENSRGNKAERELIGRIGQSAELLSCRSSYQLLHQVQSK